MELEVFKQSALSLVEHRVDSDASEPLVELAEFELELVELADEQLASELVDLAIVLIADGVNLDFTSPSSEAICVLSNLVLF